jgi:very-short-patch-repair endonuclease
VLAFDPHATYSRADLLAHFSRRTVARLVADGRLLRLRRDTYAVDAMPQEIRRAAALGAQVSCVSALALSGFWLPPGCGLHVQVPSKASRVRRGRPPAGDVRMHWVTPSRSGAVVPLDDAILRVVRCQPRRYAIAVIDSVLHRARLTTGELDALMGLLPRASRLSRGEFDGRAESGVESLVRVALRDAGLALEPQVWIPGVGRVDLLVEGRVIVEVDGRAWHRDQQSRDYRRDLEAAAGGYMVIRVDYEHAIGHEQIVVDAVLRALRGYSREGLPVTQLRNFSR